MPVEDEKRPERHTMLQSSPLTTLSSSIPDVTSSQSPNNVFSLEQNVLVASPKPFRAAKPLPFELQERCRIFFEENLRENHLLHARTLELMNARLPVAFTLDFPCYFRRPWTLWQHRLFCIGATTIFPCVGSNPCCSSVDDYEDTTHREDSSVH